MNEIPRRCVIKLTGECFSMTKSSTHAGSSTQVRHLVEKYTPNGTLSRLGPATAAGSIGGFLLHSDQFIFQQSDVLTLRLSTPVSYAVNRSCHRQTNSKTNTRRESFRKTILNGSLKRCLPDQIALNQKRTAISDLGIPSS